MSSISTVSGHEEGEEPRGQPNVIVHSEIVTAARRHGYIGLVDASLLALAARRPQTRGAILDERHFRAVCPLTGEPAFALLPTDS